MSVPLPESLCEDVTSRSLVARTAEHVRAQMTGDGSGHDWFHVQRVWLNAQSIARHETDVDILVVELAALLHDLADWKFHDGDLDAAPAAARAWLAGVNAPDGLIVAVADIVGRVSFKGAGVPDNMPSLEGRVVQDADRLDALGAVGIARAFAYGGHAGRLLHDPESVAVMHTDPPAYQAAQGATLNHFYEKLLLLADRMHTPTGRVLAHERHAYMQEFLARFLDEWEGRR